MPKQKILVPMDNERRRALYLRANGSSTRLTPAQSRRLRKHARRTV